MGSDVERVKLGREEESKGEAEQSRRCGEEDRLITILEKLRISHSFWNVAKLKLRPPAALSNQPSRS